MTELLDIDVLGTPRPKGSKRHVGNGIMLEQTKGAPEWRAAVVGAANAAITCPCPDNCGQLEPGYPHDGPVSVDIALRFPRPKSTPKRVTRPATRSTGDLDKHARNILDALQDAGVIKDDAQAVNLTVHKFFAGDREAPGARIIVRSIA